MHLLTGLSIAALPALALGHNGAHVHRHLQARQSSAAASTTVVSTSSASSAAASGATTAAASASSLAAPSVSLLSSNPTAVPLTQIVATESSDTSGHASTTYAAGATPSAVSGAPGLPDITKINPSDYPALDTPPPTDSSEVQQWIQDVANSGVTIPDIPLTVAGGCPSNPDAVANATNTGWWTCGGPTRDTDITTCPDKFTWGLTYDDGPGYYTPDLLSYLDEVNLKTTFFAVGSRCISFPALLQDEYMAGHQIAVHTWSHPYLTTLSNEEIIAEFGWTKKIIKDVLGVTPNMFRPPFGDIDDRVRAIAKAMGLTPVIWTRVSATVTFDTGDFDIHAGTITPQQVLANWDSIMGNASTIDTGFIVLEHDLFEQTVQLATGYILPDAIAHQQYNIMPVVSCLNLPMSDAYIETNDNSTNPPAVSATAVATGASGSAASAQSTSGSSSNSTSGAPRSMSASSMSLGAVVLSMGGALLAGAAALL